MTEAEKIVTKVSRDFAILKQFVQGNGSKEGSLSGRIDVLEIRSKKTVARLEIIEEYPCKDGCLYEKRQQEEENLEARKRNFRIGDLANMIQLAVLLLIVYGMFFQ